MSAINLSGNASGSGTLTITSPNTNSSYILALPEEAGTITTSNSPYSTFRNRIINGDMRIDQRNAGAAVTATAYCLDRFEVVNTTDGAFSVQQDSSAPTGFVNSLKVTTTTADATLGGTQIFVLQQKIEGTNCSDLAFGSASAKTVTLSFWVRSSLTGTFGGSLMNSANDRSYPFTYTISVADTWEYKTVTIAGDTSGTWLTTTGTGVRVFFGLGVGADRSGTAGAWNGNTNYSTTGATSVIGTLNATWYVTGVQLEVGSVATPFERIDYGRQLIQCQRYFYAPSNRTGQPLRINGTINGFLPVEMRAIPTMTVYGIGGWTGANSGKYDQDGVGNTDATITARSSTREFGITPVSGTAGGASYKAEAEL